MKFRRLVVLGLGLLVLVFVAAGCGGDDKSSEAASSSDTVSTETMNEDTTASDTTASDTTSEDTSSDSTDTNVDLGNLSGDCLEFAGIGAKIAEAMGGASGQNADLGKTAELFDELVAKAPDEIKDDLETLSEGVTKLAEAMKGVDIGSGQVPSAEQLKKMQDVMGSLDSAKLQAAAQNVEAWAKANCTKQ